MSALRVLKGLLGRLRDSKANKHTFSIPNQKRSAGVYPLGPLVFCSTDLFYSGEKEVAKQNDKNK